jgi:hypothetical protein
MISFSLFERIEKAVRVANSTVEKNGGIAGSTLKNVGLPEPK